ncbi:MAG: hypothetical protein K0R15_1344 [Clostridiales bacterium]|jgi:putative ABC transport system permease protein|nr:hypothetical protein [Clostridiales bacterium]
MFSKLAIKNVGKSIRDYTIYFLTLTFGVCLFYVFNSIEAQQAMMIISKSQQELLSALTEIMGIVSIFISVILGFLIIYANKFLIKRRKKELGIYMTLGMEKSKISKILVIETFLIGIISLAIGLIIGIFLSQGLSVVTAKMFRANLTQFKFIFSSNACIKSIINFGIIFVLVMIFNTVSISKFKLIDLLNANKKNENLKLKKVWLSIVLFISSIICLAVSYYLIIENGILAINMNFYLSLALGTLGTFLFFISLSGFLLRVIQLNKKIYLKNLNMFVLRQINSKINTTYVSMTMICIMLLITIGTLSTGRGLSDVLTSNLDATTPFDITIEDNVLEDEVISNTLYQTLEEEHVKLGDIAANYSEINIYDLGVKYNTIILKELLDELQLYGSDPGEYSVPIMKLSEFNKVLGQLGKTPIELKENEYLLTSNFDQLSENYEKFLKSNTNITIKDKTLISSTKKKASYTINTYPMFSDLGSLVIPDEMLIGEKSIKRVLNINYLGKDEETDKIVRERLDNFEDIDFSYYYSKIQIQEQSIGLSTVLSYLGIYIGLVFLITCAAILALQQLSEASDNQERYRLLRKLGAEEKMINKALFMQIIIYFMMPLFLAVIHSVVGLKVANQVVLQFGQLNILVNTITVAIFIVIIYGAYFLATYYGSKSIIKANK